MTTISRLDGNIYNIPQDQILDLYKSVGLDIGKELDGDFHLEILDKDKRIIVSDFAASYSLGRVPPNTTLVVSTKTGKILHKSFNVNTTECFWAPPQGLGKKNNYDDFFTAVDNAIKKRLPKDKPVTATLSAGHDSGSIVNGLIRCNADFNVLSALGNEPEDVLKRRWKILKHRNIPLETLGTLTREEHDQYKIQAEKDGLDDFDVFNSHYVISKLMDPGTVLLSGLGADELLQSWDLQLLERFLKGNLPVYKHFGIDIRFPLLDSEVWREWKLLARPLRKREKQPLEKYMAANNFPINKGNKVGFYIFEDYYDNC